MTEQITLHKALDTILKLKQLLKNQQNGVPQPIAIVGLSCRYPEAIGKNAYWKLLSDGKNIIEKIPEERWKLLAGSDELALKDENHPYWGGYLSGVDQFDPYFFGISPREALRMDPQHRLLLEVAYEAMEDAGLTVEQLAGSNTGVFSSLYVSQLAHQQEMESELDALFLPTGNAISIAANRISYLFDLRGPSIILDSACSSSMVGLHIACLNLQNKLCDTALVCGAKLNLLPYVNLVLSKAKMLSPNGQCKTFDKDANGYVQGEGVGVIVLKPLDKALKDNDRIYAVISGSAVNQDGKTNGLTAPNGLQQETLLKAAHQTARIDPNDISYVECHGTGTFLGDPIEIQALGEVIGKKREANRPCWIGSVKTNIGHLEPAAGVSSVIKVALALYHGKIPPHLNFSNPNPHIDFKKYQFAIPQKVEDWPVYGSHRLAGVSGFGFGGTNAHVMMREVASSEKSSVVSTQDNNAELFTISAKDSHALKLLIARWSDFIKNNSTLSLAQICYNTHLRRSHYAHRLAIIAKSKAELAQALSELENIELEKEFTKEAIFINFKNESLTTQKTDHLTLSDQDLNQLADFYVKRAPINWKKLEEHRSFPHVDLPLYPWQHKSYWPVLGHHKNNNAVLDSYPLRGKKLSTPLDTLQFEFRLDTKTMPDIKDTYNVFHAGYYIEALTFAVKEIANRDDFTVENLTFSSPLFVPDDTLVTIHVILNPIKEGRFKFTFYSNVNEQNNWVEHANGEIVLGAESEITVDSIEDIKQRCATNGTADDLYKKVIELGMPAGDSIRWTHQFWSGKNEILCEFQQPKAQKKNADFKMKIHPGIIDGSIQPIFMLLPQEANKPYIASHVNKLKHFGIQNGPYYLLITLKEIDGNHSKMVCDSAIINANGQIVFEGNDVELTQLDNKIQIQEIIQANAQNKTDLKLYNLAERRKKATEFLIDQAANIFSMPKEDVDIDRSLKDFGIDSLMALVLMRSLEIGLNTSYSMQDLLAGPSIKELAEAIATDKKYSNPTGQWIAYRKEKTDAKIKLFCFPYGGGGASIYREWQSLLPDHIEVCPIQLPGREDRLNEQPIDDIKNLTDKLIEELLPELNTPFAFFGHSFGSLVAFELGRSLRERNLPQPSHLFASAFPDPRTPTKSLDVLIEQINKIKLNLFDLNKENLALLNNEQLSDLTTIFNENGVGGYGDNLLDKDIVKTLLPTFVGDMSLVKSYTYTEQKPLEIPITVFTGKQDTWVAHEDHLTWSEHTLNKCEIHTFDSGHLFIRDNQIRADILRTITNALTEIS